MEERLSPEERLLRLIRGKKQAKPSVPQPSSEIQPSSSKRQAPLEISDTHRKTKFLTGQAPAKSGIIRQGWAKRYSSVKFTNQILFILLLISLSYLGLDFMIVRHSQFPVPLSLPEKAERIEELTFERKPYSYYLEGIQKKELFSSLGITESESSGGIPNLGETLANLNLIGIVSGANPQAIIEEKKTKKTYFLNKGDYIGQFKLGEILPGRVILIYDGQTWELNL